jgi:hypothetical protein
MGGGGSKSEEMKQWNSKKRVSSNELSLDVTPQRYFLLLSAPLFSQLNQGGHT